MRDYFSNKRFYILITNYGVSCGEGTETCVSFEYSVVCISGVPNFCKG